MLYMCADRLCLVSNIDTVANRYFCTEAVMQESSKSHLSYICGHRREGLGPSDCRARTVLVEKVVKVVIIKH